MEFFDTHTHLQDRVFDRDRKAVIDRAFNNGVQYFINVGDSLISSENAILLAKENKNCYAAIGIHPHNAADFQKDTIEKLLKLSKDKYVIAVGEIGLDFYKNISPGEKQIEVFEKQLLLTERLKLPVIIHTREAYLEVFNILKGHNLKGVFHAFSSNKEDAAKILDMGFYLGIGGILTFKNASLKDFIKFIPLNKIILETDAPYLAPYPMRGKRNEPAFIVYTAKYLSEIKNIDVEEIAHITTTNAIELFLNK